MPYLFVGLALYLLYRYYADQPSGDPADPGGPPQYVPDPGQPSAGGGGGGDSGGGGGGDTPTPPPPATATTWQPIAEGDQLQPGHDYRASAPPQNFLVMSLIPGQLASAGFTDVKIYKPGDAFPNDWPDTGNALRVAATLPSSAQPQTLSLDGVKVWQKSVTKTSGQLAQQAVRHVAQTVYTAVARAGQASHPAIVIPASNGVYAGLVRPINRK